jgi:hypothetical protein
MELNEIMDELKSLGNERMKKMYMVLRPIVSKMRPIKGEWALSVKM